MFSSINNDVQIGGAQTITGNKSFTGTTTAVTQATTDDSSKIATTAWVKDTIADYIITNYTSSASGYRVWKSGYMEQWGKTSKLSTNGTITITLSKPYTSSNYNIQVSTQAQDSETSCSRTIQVQKTVTTTNFKLVSNGWGDANNGACGYWRTVGK